MDRIRSEIIEYMTKPIAAGYNVSEYMKASGIIAYSYFCKRSYNLACFKRHRNGPKRAVQDAIDTLIASGDLVEIRDNNKPQGIGSGKHYRILMLPENPLTKSKTSPQTGLPNQAIRAQLVRR